MNSISSHIDETAAFELNDSAESLLDAWPGQELLQANLAALRRRDPNTADLVDSVEVPENVEQVLACDGSVTYRFRQNDGRAVWLGCSSVPAIAAAANLERTDVGLGNLALNTLGHGSDACACLSKMASHQALIVTDSDPLKVNLALRLHDFQRDLRLGRLVLLLDDDVVGAVERFFENNPGYHIIEQVITNLHHTETENQLYVQSINKAMENVAGISLRRVNEVLREYSAARQETHDNLTDLLEPENISQLRVINFAGSFNPNRDAVARDALAGLAQLGAVTDWMVLDQPDKVSLYWHAQRIAQHKPHIILLVDMFRKDLPSALTEGVICVTLVRQLSSDVAEEKADIAGRLGPHDMVFAADAEQLIKLRKAGVSADRSVKLSSSANTELYRPCDADVPAEFVCDVALISDRPSTNPKKYNVQLDNHQRLWQAIIDEISRDPQSYHPTKIIKFLRRAQQCGVTLKEKDLQRHFERLIANGLGSAVLCDTYSQALVAEGIDLTIWSRSSVTVADEKLPTYWFESPSADYVRGSITSPEQYNKIAKGAKIHIYLGGDDFAEAQLLNGIAAGAFCLVKAPSTDQSSSGISQMFELDKELITFSSTRDLVRKVKHYLQNEGHRREVADAARAKLLKQHSCRQRMSEMLQHLRSRFER